MKTLFIVFSAFFIWVSCSKTIPTRKYYMLDFSVDSLKTDMTPLSNDVLEVMPVRVTEAYAQHKIAVRKRSHELGYYFYHQWAESPDQSISQLILKRLNAANLFARVSDQVWNVAPRYQLNSSVAKLEALEGEDSLFAQINMRLELYDRLQRQTVVIHEFDSSAGYEDWDLNYIAQGMSLILGRELGQFADKIRNYLIANTTENLNQQ